MESVREEGTLALRLAEGCYKILVPLLWFLGGRQSPRSPAVDDAVASLLYLPMALVIGIVLLYFAGLVLAYLHQTATTPTADLARFSVLLFSFVSAWVLLTAAFYFLVRRSGVTWHRVERSSGKFLRRFRLPDNAKAEQVKASMENGVLTVTVPKEEVKKPEIKSIKISG